MFFVKIINFMFVCYSWLIIVRIAGSWFPRFQASHLMQFIAYYTDPYINFFRRFIPPIGGVLDLSPMLAFFILKIVQNIVINFLLRFSIA